MSAAYELLSDNGGFRLNLLEFMLSLQNGSTQPGDEKFELCTGRRSTLEWALATAADQHVGVTVRRGEPISGLTTGTSVIEGVPHVTGVRLTSGDEVLGDVVVDATGRRSPTLDWLEAIGGAAPIEHDEDSGFAYYTRYFKSDDGSVPGFLGPALAPYGTFSILTLPADNGTWSVTLYGLSDDKALRRFRDPDVHERVVRACPLQAHWLDGEPIGDMASMAGVVDRHRRFVVDGRPCATGLLSVGDASSCTNPSLGRGISLGLMHVELLRREIAAHLDDPASLALAFDEATEKEMRPYHDSTTRLDRDRVAGIRALLAGHAPTLDEEAALFGLFAAAAAIDVTVARAYSEMLQLYAVPSEVFARPGLVEHVRSLSDQISTDPLPGPDREQLLELVS